MQEVYIQMEGLKVHSFDKTVTRDDNSKFYFKIKNPLTKGEYNCSLEFIDGSIGYECDCRFGSIEASKEFDTRKRKLCKHLKYVGYEA